MRTVKIIKIIWFRLCNSLARKEKLNFSFARSLTIILMMALCFCPLEGMAHYINVSSYNPFNTITKVVREMDLQNQSIVSISIKTLENSNTIYNKNEDKLLHPASSLKVFTFAPTLEVLGEDYKFATTIFVDNKNNLYIKLGADPLLKTTDLVNLINTLKQNYNCAKINKIFIDDTIIDKVPYPDGWTSDDFYPNAPMISPYTLNKNTTAVKLFITNERQSITILQSNPYKHAIINELKIGHENSIKIMKNNGEQNEIINLSGTMTYDDEIVIPVANPKYNFIANLEEILKKENIDYKQEFYFAKTPNNLQQVAEVSHSMSEVGNQILKNSDNFASEIAFKVAGAKFKNKTRPGSTEDGKEMFYDYYKKLCIETDCIKIADASGVSRYNLLSTNWMSTTLVCLFKTTNIKNYLAQPDEGTLARRLRHIKGKLWAKTGTLSGISSLCGLIETNSGKNLVFSIIVSNFNKKPSVIKAFEDDLIDAIWRI